MWHAFSILIKHKGFGVGFGVGFGALALAVIRSKFWNTSQLRSTIVFFNKVTLCSLLNKSHLHFPMVKYVFQEEVSVDDFTPLSRSSNHQLLLGGSIGTRHTRVVQTWSSRVKSSQVFSLTRHKTAPPSKAGYKLQHCLCGRTEIRVGFGPLEDADLTLRH